MLHAKFHPDDGALGYFQDVAPTTSRSNLIRGHGICTKLTLLTVTYIVFVYVHLLTVSSKEAPLNIGNRVVPAAVIWATFFLWYSWIATVSAFWRRVTLTNCNKPHWKFYVSYVHVCTQQWTLPVAVADRGPRIMPKWGPWRAPAHFGIHFGTHQGLLCDCEGS